MFQGFADTWPTTLNADLFNMCQSSGSVDLGEFHTGFCDHVATTNCDGKTGIPWMVVEGCLLKAQTQAYRSQKHNCLGFLHIATVIVFIEVIENGGCLPSK